jgi:hypothetical protein
MDATMNAAMSTKSAGDLETAFGQLADMAPPGFPQWADLARVGEEAAGRKDFAAAKRICSACHEQYRPRYRAEIRSRALALPSPEPNGPSKKEVE